MTDVKIYGHMLGQKFEVEALSLQITREMAGIYTMNPKPRDFSRGKRGMAGSIIVRSKDGATWDGEYPPPFDIEIQLRKDDLEESVKIFGVEFLNEGWTMKADELKEEEQYTYLCRNIKNLYESTLAKEFGNTGPSGGGHWIFKRTE